MTDLAWLPGDEGCRARKEPVRGVLWHHTAGEGNAPAVIRTLKSRGLSIHYVIDYDGTVTMCADPATTVCYHGGSRANPAFIGVEIANKALGTPTPKHPRTRVTGSVRGKAINVLDFTEAQYASIVRLADELSDRFAIPRVTAAGDQVMKLAPFAAFRGHAEHIHCSPRKIDAATLVMAHLRSHGYG